MTIELTLTQAQQDGLDAELGRINAGIPKPLTAEELLLWELTKRLDRMASDNSFVSATMIAKAIKDDPALRADIQVLIDAKKKVSPVEEKI